MKKIYGFILLGLMLIHTISPALAATCYNSDEFEAEQGLRIHSELMVIALNCQHMAYRNGNLYMRYREVTRQNEGLFKGYEKILANYYARQGLNGDKKVTDLRTSLANEIAVKSAKMRPDIFCYNYRHYMDQALQMDQEQFRQWAKQPSTTTVTSAPLCRDRDY